MKRLLKFLLLFLLLNISFETISAQYMYATTGLLQMPTAEMQKDKTFMLGAGVLNPEIIPSKRWWGDYYTFNYYLNITILPWLEIGYNCVLVKGKPGIYHWPSFTWGKFVNQDRSFHGKLRIWKEGWWKEWTPQIVVGLNDPTSGSAFGGQSSNDWKDNGFFCRYYVAASKHVQWQGEWGLHAAYVWNEKEIHPLNGPCVGVHYSPAIHRPLKLMAEYDSETFNIGAHYQLFKDMLNIVCELNECRHPSVGIYMKVHLK